MNPNRRYDPADEPLWLIIQREDQTRCFELPSNSHKAIVVGSAETADIRIRGVAPVAFFLERDDLSIRLTPAYPQAALRLDTLKVDGNRRIYNHGLVELGDVELRLKVSDYPPTLRSDGLTYLESEISDAVSRSGTVAIDDLAVTTTADASPASASLRGNTTASDPSDLRIPLATLPTETIETVPPNFDEWFEDAIAPTPRGVIDSPLLKPIQTPLTPIDPYRTIEITANQPSDLEPTQRTSHCRLEAMRQTVTIQLGNARLAGDTTDFEVPVVTHPTQAPAQQLVGADGATKAAAEPCKAQSTCEGVATSQPHAALLSEPSFQKYGSAETVSNISAPPNVKRKPPLLMAALENLGLLAMRRPWVVLTSAAAGSFLLMMLVIGVVRHTGHGHARPSGRVVAAQPARLAGKVQSTNRKPAASTTAVPGPPVGSTQAQPATEARYVDAPASILLVPDTLPAIGHLFSGRLPEAEQAYRELAKNFPDDLAFRAASKILGRRNSPACRLPNSPSTSCPSVKP